MYIIIYIMTQKKRWGKKFKDKRNWKEYNEHLIRRGEYYINPIFPTMSLCVGYLDWSILYGNMLV